MTNLINDTRRDDLLKAVRSLGKTQGAGDNAKVNYARSVLLGGIDGYAGTGDAPAFWAEYRKGVSANSGDEHADANKTAAQDKTRTSETKQIITVGLMAIDAMDLFDRTVQLCHRLTPNGSTYENVVKICRVQIKSKDAVLTDEQIAEVMFPEAKAKEELKLMKAILKAAEKCRDGSKGDEAGAGAWEGFPSNEVDAIVGSAAARIAILERASKVNQIRTLMAESGDVFTQEQLEALQIAA